MAQRVFDTRLWRADQPLRVVLIGSDFEVRVWEALLKIPMGRAVQLFGHRQQDQQPEGLARGRRRGRTPTRCHSWCRATARSARAAR
jgi:AraC family transcriptional regulator of adaptative response/methylated-DNA-[protein]-cysteine methyltransferase